MGNSVPVQYFFGRQVLYSNEETVTNDNIVDILKSVLPNFNKNKIETEYLYNYYRGNQPILNRTKKVRPEINNKVIENHAHEIVSFKVGYEFGEPVQYVRRAIGNSENLENENTEKNVVSNIALLNEYMFQQDKATRDKELANPSLFQAQRTEW